MFLYISILFRIYFICAIHKKPVLRIILVKKKTPGPCRKNTGLFKMIFGVQFSSVNSAPNSVNNRHLTIPFEGGTHSLKRQAAWVCEELKVRIRTAIETITADMRNEIDYRVDVCRITKGEPIEHL